VLAVDLERPIYNASAAEFLSKSLRTRSSRFEAVYPNIQHSIRDIEALFLRTVVIPVAVGEGKIAGDDLDMMKLELERLDSDTHAVSDSGCLNIQDPLGDSLLHSPIDSLIPLFHPRRADLGRLANSYLLQIGAPDHATLYIKVMVLSLPQSKWKRSLVADGLSQEQANILCLTLEPPVVLSCRSCPRPSVFALLRQHVYYFILIYVAYKFFLV
jgi:hypothetical protein